MPNLLSMLSDPIWMTATDFLHVNTASGAWLVFWFIPCPTWISPLWLQAADCRRLAEHRASARTLTQATDAWTDTGSLNPHWHGPLPGHLVPLEQMPVTYHTRLQDSPPLRPSDWLPTSTSSPPLPAVSFLLPRTEPVGHESASRL